MWVISKMDINSRISISISSESVSIILDYKIFLAILDFIFNAIQNIFLYFLKDIIVSSIFFTLFLYYISFSTGGYYEGMDCGNPFSSIFHVT